MRAMMSNIAQLKKFGNNPIVIHGGGTEISKLLEKLGIEAKFIKGLRITDKAKMDIVQMVLIGKVNKELIKYLNAEKVKAVGLSGYDAELLIAEKYQAQGEIDLGFVGKIIQVNSAIIDTLLDHDYLPVIAPIALSHDLQAYNINADSAASSIAIACKADHLVFLKDVPGILRDVSDPDSKIDAISSFEIDKMIATGQLTGGILPKLEGALEAVKMGIANVHILDGRIPNCLERHFLKGERLGTIITANTE